MKKFKAEIQQGQKRRSEIRYFDDQRNPVPQERATWALVRELDENGNLLLEIEGFLD